MVLLLLISSPSRIERLDQMSSLGSSSQFRCCLLFVFCFLSVLNWRSRDRKVKHYKESPDFASYLVESQSYEGLCLSKVK